MRVDEDHPKLGRGFTIQTLSSEADLTTWEKITLLTLGIQVPSQKVLGPSKPT